MKRVFFILKFFCLIWFIANMSSCSSCDRTVVALLSIGDITEIHRIPETNYSLTWFPEMEISFLEREPSTRESYDFEFSNVKQVFYNKDYIVGKGKRESELEYFIIELRALPDGEDRQLTFKSEEDFISVKDSLGISESNMKVVKLSQMALSAY